MPLKTIGVYITLFSLPLTACFATGYDSSYTPLKEENCTTLSLDEESGGITQSCQGFGNYGVQLLEGDLRQSLTLTRDGKEYPLHFWTTVSPAFTYLGEVIEWRHTKGKPDNVHGMIVRLNASEDSIDTEKTTSYLVVTKITDDRICVVNSIPPQKDQNLIARQQADNSSDSICVEDKP